LEIDIDPLLKRTAGQKPAVRFFLVLFDDQVFGVELGRREGHF
jgi:hypothetical protein